MIKVTGTPEELQEITTALHYPEHWDTAVYPTLDDAVWEILMTYDCSECQFAGILLRQL